MVVIIYMSKVQSILFSKDLYSIGDAISFLARHNFKWNKLDIKDKYLRFRQFTPNKENKHYTKEISEGILFIFEVKEV